MLVWLVVNFNFVCKGRGVLFSSIFCIWLKWWLLESWWSWMGISEVKLIFRFLGRNWKIFVEGWMMCIFDLVSMVWMSSIFVLMVDGESGSRMCDELFSLKNVLECWVEVFSWKCCSNIVLGGFVELLVCIGNLLFLFFYVVI